MLFSTVPVFGDVVSKLPSRTPRACFELGLAAQTQSARFIDNTPRDTVAIMWVISIHGIEARRLLHAPPSVAKASTIRSELACVAPWHEDDNCCQTRRCAFKTLSAFPLNLRHRLPNAESITSHAKSVDPTILVTLYRRRRHWRFELVSLCNR